MCQINPKHEQFFELEVFTSDQEISKEDFTRLVAEKLFAVEMELNKDMRLRFHIHEKESTKCLAVVSDQLTNHSSRTKR